MQAAYSIGKVSFEVITMLSLTSMSQNVNDSMTTCVPVNYGYEAVALFNDNTGNVCTSSELQNNVVGDIVTGGGTMFDFDQKHKRENVKLHITKISKHISNFEFEEEYEEI